MSSGRLLTNLIASTGAGEGVTPWWTPIVYVGLVCLIILTFGLIAVQGAKLNVPRNPITRIMEHVYLFIENMTISVIGPHGRRYIPYIFTLYVIILTSNLLGLFGLMAPTSQLGVTLGLAVIVFAYVQWEGIKANGPVGYIAHFFGPKLGLGLLLVSILLFFIEVISEFAKILSLSLRLQGNISGEHMVKQVLGGLVSVNVPWSSQPFGIPIDAVLIPLGVFVSIVQALVFTMLACVYLSLFTHHSEEHTHAH